MMPATLSIITQAFPAEQRGTAIGTWAGVSALALAVGPILGGFLTEDIGWRAIFYINPPIAVGAVAVTLFATRESRDETAGRSLDLPGIATLTAGLTALVLALVESNNWHWGSARIVGLFAVAVIALAMFVVIELRVRAPMLDFSFFRSRTSAGANLVAFLVTFAMFAMFFFMTLYMQNVLHYSPLQTGVRFLPATLAIIVMGPVAGRLTDRIGPRPLMALGLAVIGAALLIQSRLTIHSGYGLLLPGFILMGTGIGLVMSPMSTAAMNAVDRAKSGAASGVISMSRMVGGSVGLAVMGALVTTVGRSRLDSTLAKMPAAARDKLATALGTSVHPAGHSTPQIVHALHDAFVSALAAGLKVSAAVALVGAVLALWLIDPVRAQPSEHLAPEAASA
jgi:EmrB/QacA subfamily drug resistance transporter